MVDLKKDISLGSLKSLGKNSVPTALPAKNSINLAQGTSGNFNRRMAAIAFVALVVVVLLLCKLFVVDPLASAVASGSQVSQLESTLAQMKAENESYAAVSDEYARYVITDLTDEEAAQVDRKDVCKLISRYLLDVGTLQSLQVAGNVITANLGDVTMSEVSAQIARIKSDDLVSKATVSTAQGQNSSDSKETTATIIITLVGADVSQSSTDDDPSHDTVYEALTGDDLDD